VPCGFYALGHRRYIYTAKFNSVRTLSLALRRAAWPRHAHAMLPKRVAAFRQPTGNSPQLVLAPGNCSEEH